MDTQRQYFLCSEISDLDFPFCSALHLPSEQEPLNYHLARLQGSDMASLPLLPNDKLGKPDQQNLFPPDQDPEAKRGGMPCL